jgi:non-heme chloroperoxidase
MKRILSSSILIAGALFVQSTGLSAAPAKVKMVKSSDGVLIATARWGKADGTPIVFVHGWSQAGASWKLHVNGPLAAKYNLITLDLRGHGASGKPADLGAYTKPGIGGNDLRDVIAAYGLKKPVLVGWSYGTEIVREYLADHGDKNVRGVVLVSGPASPKDFGKGLLSVVPGMLSPNMAVNVTATMQFMRNASATPLAPKAYSEAVGLNMATAIVARLGVLKRTKPPAVSALAKLKVPALIIHGKADNIILVSGAAGLAKVIPNATVKTYDGVGHLPFIEAQKRFDSDIATFVSKLK